MKCSFCSKDCTGSYIANALCLCPECLAQLLAVSPSEKRYGWFVSAMRRAIMDA